MTRCLIYSRQSIEKDDGERSLSLDSQVTALRDRCQRESWTIVGVVRESGLKGYQDVDERPGMAEAIGRAEAGDYDLFLVWDLSRLARSLRLQEQWVWQFDRLGVAVVSHTEPESGDALIRQIKGAVAEHRTREIAAHVRRALRENTRRQIPHGSAPFGYSRGADRRLVPNAEEAVVQRIFRRRAEGASLGEIAAELRADSIPGPGGSVWFRATLTHMLSNPVYRGTLCLAELQVPNAHPAIIDEAIWQRANDVGNARPRSPRSKPYRSWLEGLIVHDCGAPMYLVGGSLGHASVVFRCRTGAGWSHPDAVCQTQPRQIAADRAEALTWQEVTAAVSRVPRSPAGAIRHAHDLYRRIAPIADSAHRMALERKNRAVARRERVIELYLAGAIDRPRFDAESAAADSELQKSESQIAELPAPPDDDALTAAWAELRSMRQVLASILPEHYSRWLRMLGVAVVSPAGVPLITGRRGPRPDAGRIAIRFRDELAVVFSASPTP